MAEAVVDHPFWWRDRNQTDWHYHVTAAGQVLRDYPSEEGAHRGADCPVCRVPSPQGIAPWNDAPDGGPT